MVYSTELEKHVWDKVRQSPEYMALLKKIENHIMSHGSYMDDAFFANLSTSVCDGAPPVGHVRCKLKDCYWPGCQHIEGNS